MEKIEYPIKFYRNKETNVIYKGVLIDVIENGVNINTIFDVVDTLLKDSNIKDFAILPSNIDDGIYGININKTTLYTLFGVNAFLTDGNKFIIQPRKNIEENYVEMTLADIKRWNKVIYIKQCRQDIDNIIQKVREIGNSNPVEYSLKGLTEGCMWLGMELKRLNQPDPYPSSKDPSTGDTIEQTADNLKL